MSPISTLLQSGTRGRVPVPPASGGGSATNFDFFTDFSAGLTPQSETGRETEPPIPSGVVSWQGAGSDRYVQSDFKPPTADQALLFVFPATPDPSTDSNVEQNLLLGRMIGGANRHFGLSFDFLVDSNFTLRDPGNPTKLFQFWEQFYSNTCTCGITLRAEGDGSCIVQPFITGSHPNGGSPFYGLGQANPKVFPSVYGERFIAPLSTARGAVLPGTSANIKYLTKFSSSATATDGWVKLWVDDVLFMEAGPQNIWSFDVAGPNPPVREPKIGRGYLMGYSNSGYLQQTRFAWSRVRIVDFNPGWT